MATKIDFLATDKEKLELLEGDRRKRIGKAAVRLEDLAPLLQLAQDLQSASVTSAPTAADHNKLVTDVRNIQQRLVAISELLSERMR